MIIAHATHFKQGAALHLSLKNISPAIKSRAEKIHAAKNN